MQVGHGEAVSGLTSIIKATLALEHRAIPPTRGIENVNPNLQLAERNIEIVQCTLPWPIESEERISVNAFGYGGANAHAIIDSAAMHLPTIAESSSEARAAQSLLLPFSAHCPESLAENMNGVAQLEMLPWELPNLAYTLTTRRSRLNYRSYMIGSPTSSGVRMSPYPPSPSQSTTTPKLAFVFTGQGAQWPGMGRELLERFSAYGCVIDDLDAHLQTLPQAPTWTIKQVLLEDAEIGSIYKASRSQTICTAVQIALVSLLQTWDVTPGAVIGHSSGEIAAAFAASYISAHEGLAIAYYRGLVSETVPTEGGMVAVGLGADRVRELISSLGLQDAVRVACINSPESTTASGEASAVNALLQALQERKVFVRELKTDGKAYHSHLMELVGGEYEQLLGSVLSEAPPMSPGSEVDMFSTVTTHLSSRDLMRCASYWRTNLESPVQFKNALKSLVQSGTYHLVEIGPHPALGQPIRDIINSMPNEALRYCSSLQRGKSGEICLLHLAGQLFMAGMKFDLSRVDDVRMHGHADEQAIVSTSNSSTDSVHRASDSGVEDMSRRDFEVFNKEAMTHPVPADETSIAAGSQETVKETQRAQVSRNRSLRMRLQYRSRVFQKLPPYSWHHQAPLWAESRQSQVYRNTKFGKHELLGSKIPAIPGSMVTWRNQLKLVEVPWIADHKLGSTIVFPAAGYMAMAIEAFLQLKDRPRCGSVVLRQVYFLNMLVFSDSDREAIEISTVLAPEQISQATSSDLWWNFRISSFVAGTSTTHAYGLIGLSHDSSLKPEIAYPENFGKERQASRTMYNRLAAQGLCFGPQFKSLKSIFTDRHRQSAFSGAETDFRSGDRETAHTGSDYLIHPATIDSLLQAAIVASCKGASEELYGKVPVEVENLSIVLEGLPQTLTSCSIRANATAIGFDATLLCGELEDAAGRILASIKDVRAIGYRETSLAPKSTLQRNPALRILWKPDVSMMTQSSPDALREYIERYQCCLPAEWSASDEHVHLVAVLDLLTHKDGRMKILELGEHDETGFHELVQRLSLSHVPRRYHSYTRGKINQAGGLQIHGVEQNVQDPPYSLIIIPSKKFGEQLLEDMLEKVLLPDGILVFVEAGDFRSSLRSEVFYTTSVLPKQSDHSVTLARRAHSSQRSPVKDPRFTIVSTPKHMSPSTLG